MADSDQKACLPSHSPSASDGQNTSVAQDAPTAYPTAPSPSLPSGDSASVSSAESTASTASPSAASSASASSSSHDNVPTLDQARAFLHDDAVQRESRPRKAAFLASKGLASAQIDLLLAEEDGHGAAVRVDQQHEQQQHEQPVQQQQQQPSLPPIVTFPEFLAHPPRPPPLVTPNVLLGALYGSAAVSTLLYATARLVVAPMVDALTASRVSLHETAADNLTRLLGELGKTVSVVPDTAKPGTSGAVARLSADIDIDIDNDVVIDIDNDDYDDPTEVFHRDVGVQTSPPPSPPLPAAPSISLDSTVPQPSPRSLSPSGAAAAPPSQTQYQTARLASLVSSVRSLSEGWTAPAEVLADVRTAVSGFREDVDRLTRLPAFAGASGGGYGSALYGFGSIISPGSSSSRGYVTTTRNEPDDEIRKAKENIRRVKGALLTTRTFPAARLENAIS